MSSWSRTNLAGLIALAMIPSATRAGPIDPLVVPAPAANLDNAVFDQLVADLDSNVFEARLKATNLLISYVNPASATRLTVAQLQTLRNLAQRGTLPEQRSRAGMVILEWVRLNPNTVAPARALLDSIKIKFIDFNPNLGFLGGEGHFMLGPFKVGYEAPVIKKLNIIGTKYLDASNQLADGLTDNVVPALTAMKQAVADLTNQDLNSLTFLDTRTNMFVDRASVVKELDNGIKSAGELLKKVNNSIGDPAPGPAPKIPIPGTGMIDTGKNFQLTLNGIGLTPGNLTFLGLAPDLSIAAPPTGFSFFGPVFVLSADDTLALQPGPVDVAIEYGDPSLQGLPTSLASQFQLVHFANGRYTPFDSVSNDTIGFVLSGIFQPPSPSSGLDQFGEFAVIRETPEPATLWMLGLGLALTALACARHKTFGVTVRP